MIDKEKENGEAEAIRKGPLVLSATPSTTAPSAAVTKTTEGAPRPPPRPDPPARQDAPRDPETDGASVSGVDGGGGRGADAEVADDGESGDGRW